MMKKKRNPKNKKYRKDQNRVNRFKRCRKNLDLIVLAIRVDIKMFIQ